MKVTEKALKEFKKIYKDEFGVTLTNQQALDKSVRVLKLFKVLMTTKHGNTSINRLQGQSSK